MMKGIYHAALFAIIWPAVHLAMGHTWNWWHLAAGAAAGFVFGYGRHRIDLRKK